MLSVLRGLVAAVMAPVEALLAARRTQSSGDPPRRADDSASRTQARLEAEAMASRPGIETARLAATDEAVGEERREGEATYRVRPGEPDSEARWNPFASEQSRGFRVRAARTEAQRRVRIRDAASAEAQRRRATHYEVLGVDPSATNREIERAYRALVVRYHPDRVQQDEAARVEAERVMRRLNAAMAVLRDPEKRARYDRAHLT